MNALEAMARDCPLILPNPRHNVAEYRTTAIEVARSTYTCTTLMSIKPQELSVCFLNR